ncbi:WxL domain-containing protein [Enterococcus sp. AZ126]|uniref:WxL domain-containing protein n=1 Tax=Enterococcus sp. AZ126 TaxID=2774635 RepID=UPI003F289D1B
MNKKVLLGFAATAALGTALVAGQNAHAVENATNMDTDTGISFFDTNKPGPGPFEGNLAIAYVPSNFDFGSNDVTGVTNAVTYNQVLAAGKKQYVAVSDDRKENLDSGTQWQLSATLDDFVSTAAAAAGGTIADADKLANAELSFKLGEYQGFDIDVVNSDATKVVTPNITDANSLYALNDKLSPAYAGPAAGSFVTLTAGASTGAISVANYTSTGAVKAEDLATGANTHKATTLAAAREVSSVRLKVKDTTNANNKKFTSTVHWSLADTVAP